MEQKLGIILDSFSTITDEQEKELGYKVLKLSYELDGQKKIDNIQVHDESIRRAFEEAKNIATSLPNLDVIQTTLKEFSLKYNDVLVIPIPKSLSGTYNAVSTAAKDHHNIHVLDHKFSCGAIIAAAKWAQEQYAKGMSIEDIIKVLGKNSEGSATFVGLESIQYLAKGGRLQKIPQPILKMLKISPVIEFSGKNALKGFSLKSQGMVKKLFSHIEKFINGWENKDNYDFHVMRYFEGEPLTHLHKKLSEVNVKLTSELWGSLVVMAHTGPTAFGICITPKFQK
ncbi:DegV family protein [Mycoplasma testudineum]|nr:DegV family protein [Mycoplasma testudineum]